MTILHSRGRGVVRSTLRHPTRGSSVLLLGFDLVFMVGAYFAFMWTPLRGTAFLALTLGVLLVKGHYRTRMARDIGEDVSTILSALASVFAVVIFVAGVFGVLPPQPSTVLAASVGLFVVLMTSRWLAFALLKRIRRAGLMRSRALVVGTGPVAREIGVEFARRLDYGVDIVGYVSTGELKSEVTLPGAVLGTLDGLRKVAQLTAVDRLIVTTGQGDDGEVLDAIRQLPVPGISVFVLPQVFGLGFGADPFGSDQARGYSLVRMAKSSHPVIGLRFKRLFDIVAAGLMLLVASPVLLMTAIAVKATSRGPILFRQVRVGRFGRPFALLKFRSMTVNSDSDSAWTPDASEATLTPIGRFIRWSSIDELPQLWNIVRGDMSFVGPRPERPAFVEHYSATVAGYEHRHRLPVGLTGLAQVRGLRGDTSIEERVKMDNLYIDQWSFFRDLRLILQTVWAIVRQGAYAEAHIDVEAALAAVENQEQVVIDLVQLDKDRLVDEAESPNSRLG